MEKKTWTYVLGALLIAFGVMFILSPSGTFETIVLIAGIILILFNCLKILGTLKSNNIYTTYGITSSVIGIIFGIILIGNKETAIKVIPVLLGLWLLVSGISSLVFLTKTSKNKTQITKAVLKTILGIISFALPVIPVIGAGLIIGIVLILAGITTITNAKDDEVIYKVKIKK